MRMTRWIRGRGVSGLLTLSLCVASAGSLAGQGAAPSSRQAKDAAGFKEFAERVQAYLKLQKAVVADLPALKSTELPEMISAYQEALARKIRESRPRAKAGDLFTSSAREAFRRASLAALGGPGKARSREYMKPDGPDPRMRLVVNAVYSDTEPITPIPPDVLAAFPPLPVELAYRVVDRALVLLDVKARLVVDVARNILPPTS